MSKQNEIDINKLPQHIAIIMDGNGRWAQARGLNRSMGHQEGVETVRKITTAASLLGLKYLTLYTFSTENWNRPAAEVSALMHLILVSLQEELFMKNNVRMQVIGDRNRLPHDVRTFMEELEHNTQQNDGLTLVIALSYSSKWEITQAVKQIVKAGIPDEQIDENTITRFLQTKEMPDPDLLIRTGGEQRLSNYLLWQCAYTELYFCDTFWPDFNEEDFYQAIVEYQQRERRFGKTSEQIV